jgi:hypothetical protein
MTLAGGRAGGRAAKKCARRLYKDMDIKIDWRDIERQMPDLILDLMAGLRCYGCDTVREFCVLPNQGHRPSPGNRFAFFEDENADLLGKIGLLVKNGYVVPVTSETEPVYRMTDEFAAHLLDGWPERRWPDW